MRAPRIRFKALRRVVGIGSLFLFALAFVGCDTTNHTGYDYQGAAFRLTLVVGAIDLQIERAASPAGWTVIEQPSSRFNGLAYYNPVFTASRVMVPFFHLGAVALLIAIACILPDFLRAQREANRRWNGQCVGCGYSLRGNTSGVCPECGRRGVALDRHPWKLRSLDDRLKS